MSPNEYIKTLKLYADYIKQWLKDHEATEEDCNNPDFEDEGISGTSECYVCFNEWLDYEYKYVEDENEDD